MDKVSSTPVTPSQPNASSFPPSALNLLPEYTRASYKAAFGVDPATYDFTKPTKAWFDTSNADSAAPVSYSYLAFIGGVVTLKMLTMSGIEAAQVNLYGVHEYPPYVMAPSHVMRGGLIIPANQLSTPKEANELAWALEAKDTVVIEEQDGSLFGVVYPEDEERRICRILFKGNLVNAGLLIQKRNAHGVDSPGHWNLDGIEPAWMSEIPMMSNLENPPLPVPQRALLDDERIAVGAFGFTIYRVDSGSPVQPGVGSGSFTAEDRATLARIEAAVGGARNILAGKAAAATQAATSSKSDQGQQQVKK